VRQLVLPGSWDGGPECVLTGREARRLTSVLRMARGDTFPAIGADGAAYACTVQTTGKESVTLAVVPAAASAGGYKPDVRTGRAEPAAVQSALASPGAASMPRLVLAVALLKGSKLDEVTRAATEAGVSSIIPLATTRSVPKNHAAGRMERLRRVAAEALGQSGSSIPTRIMDPLTISELCAAFPPVPGKRLGLFFHETPLAQASIHRYCTVVPDEIIACVGPEGGFDDDEVRALAEGGYKSAWLGPTVLRAETAAVFAVASLRTICLERSSWSTTAYEE